MHLRNWQQEFIDNFPSVINKHRRFIVKAPTGAGKTVLAGEIVERFYKGKKIIVLCHRLVLLEQLEKALGKKHNVRKLAVSDRGPAFENYEILLSTSMRAKEVLADAPKDVWLIIENGAGMRNQIGSTFRELGGLVKATGDSRLKICLDTQHCFAAGYNIAHEETIAEVMTEFDQEIGLENLVAVHANDSKQPLACRVDRHENLGEGYIGLDGFLTIMKHPAFQNIPFLLEVPGFTGGGPDKENIGTVSYTHLTLPTILLV